MENDSKREVEKARLVMDFIAQEETPEEKAAYKGATYSRLFKQYYGKDIENAHIQAVSNAIRPEIKRRPRKTPATPTTQRINLSPPPS